MSPLAPATWRMCHTTRPEHEAPKKQKNKSVRCHTTRKMKRYTELQRNRCRSTCVLKAIQLGSRLLRSNKPGILRRYAPSLRTRRPDMRRDVVAARVDGFMYQETSSAVRTSSQTQQNSSFRQRHPPKKGKNGRREGYEFFFFISHLSCFCCCCCCCGLLPGRQPRVRQRQ